MNRVNRAAAEKYVRDVNREIDRVNHHNKRIVDDHNREVDRVNRHNERVVADRNRAARQYNQNARAAAAKYNQAARTQNAKVAGDRQRYISALRSQLTTRYVEVRSSTLDLNDRYERVRQEAQQSSAISELLSLFEREASNSAAVAEALISDVSVASEAIEDSGIVEYLSGFSEDLRRRWEGAVYALNPVNPDAGRHFCTSVREIFTEILDKWAVDDEVFAADPQCEVTQKGTPTRRAKIRFLLERKGAGTVGALDFTERNIDDILQLFHVFNEATHGPAGKHGFAKLQAIRQRVEGGIMFLANIAL